MSFSTFIDSVRKRDFSVAVAGDAMLDLYRYGKVSRISPEFPVPILLSPDETVEYYPGGAANVCYQFKHFRTKPYLLSFLDYESHTQLRNLGINVDWSVTLEQGVIPRKMRYYDHDFPLLRHDIEKPNYGCHDLSEYRKVILDNFIKISSKLDVLILTNYNKGFFDRTLAETLVRECNRRGIITVVDPKSKPDWWQGCTIFKPNASEAYGMTGVHDWREQTQYIKEETKCECVVITQAGSGVVGLADDYFEYRPRYTIRDVSSVIGAGDCFAAILAISCKYLEFAEACQCAFEAGAEYVKAKHNRPILPYELHRRLDPLHAKIVSLPDLLYIRECYADQRWTVTNGVYDLIHLGHLATIQQAKQRGDKLVIAINSDESVRRLKGSSRPILPLQERMQIVAALENVDFVVSFDEDTPYEVIKTLKPHVLVKGADYRVDEIAGHDLVEEVFLAEMVPGNSTTNIIAKIRGEK